MISLVRCLPAVFLLTAVSACTSTVSLSDFDEPDFDVVVERYRLLEGSKALALATEANGRFAWGVAMGEGSAAAATAAAIDRCRDAARDGGMRSECIPFAIGDGPAADTVEACNARRLGSRRCEMQKAHGAKLGG